MVEDYLLHENNPFSEKQLTGLFELHPSNPSRLLNKESNNVEYKLTFHFESFDNHARTFAAFANTNGGYLIFGVNDETRELVV